MRQVEERALKVRTSFDRQRLPGKKRDLLELARRFSPILKTISEASFEEYMRSLEYRFPLGTQGKDDLFYRQLFPEFFK